MARRKKSPKPSKSSTLKKKGRSSAPRTGAQYRALSRKSKDSLERSLSVVSKLKNERTSLRKASHEVGIDPETVKRWAASALKKRNGRFAAKSSDQLFRVLKLPDENGVREIGVRGSRQATVLAEYWNGLSRYLQTGQSAELDKFRGRFIKDADGNQIPLLTDQTELKRLARASVLSFESIYSHTT
jgi:hypothetical protein